MRPGRCARVNLEMKRPHHSLKEMNYDTDRGRRGGGRGVEASGTQLIGTGSGVGSHKLLNKLKSVRCGPGQWQSEGLS